MWPVLFWLPAELPFIGGRPVFTYGVLLGLAYLVAWWVALARVPSELESRARVAYLLTGVSGWLGARWLGPTVDHAAEPLVGGTLWPGILASFVTLALASRALRLPRAVLIDAACLGAAVGIGVGRVGCFLHGCDYGVASAAWWAVEWPTWSGEFGGAATDSTATLGRLPVQLLESLAALGLAGLITRVTRPGAATWVFFVGYAFVRLFLERLRGDPSAATQPLGLGFTVGQMTSLGVLLVCGLALTRRYIGGRRAVHRAGSVDKVD